MTHWIVSLLFYAEIRRQLLGQLSSIRSETRVFQKPRHPGECRDPWNSAIYWIPAFAGMTGDAVYGWALSGYLWGALSLK